jgi:hypothetical protein
MPALQWLSFHDLFLYVVYISVGSFSTDKKSYHQRQGGGPLTFPANQRQMSLSFNSLRTDL